MIRLFLKGNSFAKVFHELSSHDLPESETEIGILGSKEALHDCRYKEDPEYDDFLLSF